MNQYFQILTKEHKVSLRFIPPTDGGAALTIGEVTGYLESRNIRSYDIKALNAAVTNTEETSEVIVGDWDGIPFNEYMNMHVSLDKMKVTCRFYPASEGGSKMDIKEIMGDFSFRKITHGIMQEEILKFIQNPMYCTDYILVQGTAPVHGHDAKIEYFFNTSKTLQPKRNEDGSVDYKDLNTISRIQKGALLARLIPMDPGKPGRNVYNEEIKPRNVKNTSLSYGKNISINEEKTEIYSDVTGHASLYNDKVFVSDVYEVPADVDNSTGNIEYEGSVLIHGNVKTGFSVKASGDIIVEGVVEGASLEAGGQIIVKHGIHGMFKGVFVSKTNLMAKFIENATVNVGGYIEAELLLNCDVSAKDCIRIHGKKGLINGGVVRAGNYIETESVGNEIGTATTLEVGVDPERKNRYYDLTHKVEELTKDINDAKVILANYGELIKKKEYIPQDKMKYIQQLAVSTKQKQDELDPMKEEMKKVYSEILASNHGYVVVNQTIYAGNTIAISDLSYTVKSAYSHCKFKKQEGAVKSLPI